MPPDRSAAVLAARPLHVLVAGASGTLGRRLCVALRARGYRVSGLARRVTPELIQAGIEPVEADVRDWSAAQWQPVLHDVDVVINAIGIFQEADGQRFDALHERLPRALFSAAAKRGVRLAVQISALGADEHAETAYHLSKRHTDDWLLSQPLAAVVVQPSLVFAPDGPSARLFLRLAALPIWALPAGGQQPLQPIHVDDAAQAICALVDDPQRWQGRRVALVGPRPETLQSYLQALRQAMGLRSAWRLSVPASLAGWGAAMAGRLPGALLNRDSWSMLQRGNAADARDTTQLLGHPPRPPQQFLDPAMAPALRWEAQWTWLSWSLRLALAFIWIFTAIVSAFVFPVSESVALLAAVGTPDWLHLPALFGAALFDLVLGLSTLFAPRRWRLPVWWTQVALMLFYTVVLTWHLPQFWWHPYGPLSKNAAILAVLTVLIAADGVKPPLTQAQKPAR